MHKYITLSNQIHQTAKQSVNDSAASLFTKDDVTRFLDYNFGKILDAITEAFEVPTPAPQQEAIGQGFTREDVESVIKAAYDSLNHSQYLQFDEDTACFELYGDNKLNLTDVEMSISNDMITDLLQQVDEGFDALVEQVEEHNNQSI